MNATTRLCGWLGAMSLLLCAAQAEIVHQSPGWLSAGPGLPVPLDLDGDGTPEFSFSGEYLTCFSLEGCGLNYLMRWGAREGCDVLLTSTSWFDVHECEPGELIGPDPGATNFWWDFTSVGIRVSADIVWRHDDDLWQGPLDDVNNRYLGVRFTTTNGVHYGWIRLVSGLMAAGVQEWAYETQPGTALRAGETAIPALNDNFAARAPLAGDYLEATANNIAATAETGEPDHAGLSAGASLWWTWTASTNGWVTLSSLQSAFTPCFAVYRGADLTNLSLVALSPVKCAEQGWGVLQSISQTEIFRVAAGEIYQVAFDSPRSVYGDYDPTNAPRGQIRFSLVFSTLEITSPTNGATFFTDSVVPVSLDMGGATGMLYGFSLEMDSQTVVREPFVPDLPPSPWLLTNLPPGLHTLRARASDLSGRERFSPPVQIHVRPANDDFARAVALAGTNLSWAGNTYYATMEPGEPSHPSGHDGFTVWYRWTAPGDGVARIAIPTGGGVALTVFRGNNLTNLEPVAANPAQDTFWAMTRPLHPLLHFATRTGETYAMQVSSRWWGYMIMAPSGPCDPPWITGYPFAMHLEFVPHPVGKLDMVFSPGVPPFLPESILFLFAVARDSQFVLETSTNLVAWDPAITRRTATGAMEVVRLLPPNFVWPSRFFRVRLEQ